MYNHTGIIRTPIGFPIINKDSPQSDGLVCWLPFTTGPSAVIDLISGQRAKPVASDLVEAFPVDGDTGSTVLQLVRNNSEYLKIPSSKSLQVDFDDFSVSCWINTSLTTNTRTIWSIGDVGSTNNSARLVIIAEGRLQFIGTVGGSSFNIGPYYVGLSDGEWHHVVFTRTNNVYRWIIDGVPGNKETVGSNVDVFGDGEIVIGSNQTLSTDFYEGKIHDFRVYRKALSPDEAAALRNPQTRWDLWQPRTLSPEHLTALAAPVNEYFIDGSGGIRAAGDAVVRVVDNETATGGIRAAGDAVVVVVDNETATGGIRAAGDAVIVVVDNETATGGIRAAGDIVVTVIYNEIASGGISATGDVPPSGNGDYTPSGGINVAGEATVNVIDNEIASGGINAAGDADLSVVGDYTPTGGAQAAGDAIVTVVDNETPTGGISAAGDTIVTVTDSEIATGGSQAAGDSVNTVTDNEIASGGIRAAGDAVVTVTDNEIASGGIRAAGDAVLAGSGDFIPTGGIRAAGDSEQSYVIVATTQGGVFAQIRNTNYYPIESTDGSTIYDAKGGINATFTGSLINDFAVPPPYPSNRVAYVTEGQYLKLASAPDLKSIGNWTISFWARSQYGNSSSNEFILDKLSTDTGYGRLELWLNSGVLRLRVYDTSNNLVGTLTDASALLNAGRLQHIAITRECGTDFKFYVDGQLKSTLADTYTNLPIPPLLFGTSGTEYAFFFGHLDEIRLYNGALKPTEIEALSAGYEAHTASVGVQSNFNSSGGVVIAGTAALSGSAVEVVSGGVSAAGDGLLSGTVGYAPSGGAIVGQDQGYSLYLESGEYGIVSQQDEIDLQQYGNNWSVSFWVKPSELSSGQSYICLEWGDGTDIGVSMSYSGSFRRLTLELVSTTPTYHSYFTPVDSIASGSWHHVVWTRSGAAIKCYVNGSEVSLTTSNAISSGTVLATDYDLYFGSRPFDSYDLRGNLDQINLYSGTLSASEVTALYSDFGNGVSTQLVCEYRCNRTSNLVLIDSQGGIDGLVTNVSVWSSDTSPNTKQKGLEVVPLIVFTPTISGGIITGGNAVVNVVSDPLKGIYSNLVARYCPSINDSANDISGNGLNGIYQNSMGTVNDLNAGGTKAYSLNGTNEYILLPSSINNLLNPEQITVSAWAKADTLTGYRPILTEHYGPDLKVRFMLGVFTDGYIAAGFYDGSAWRFTYVTGTTGSWVHYAATYDRTSIKLYVNGSQVASISETGPMSGSEAWYIGKRWDLNDHFDGLIDDVQIHNVAFTSTEITTLYNGGQGRGYSEATGVDLEGQATVQVVNFYNVDTSGASLAGNADVAEYETIIGDGGIACAGDAIQSLIQFYTPTGSSLLAGDSLISEIGIEGTSGGIAVGGDGLVGGSSAYQVEGGIGVDVKQLAYWRIEESFGSTAIDELGNITAVASGERVSDHVGMPYQSLYQMFATAGDHFATTTTIPIGDIDNWALSFWMYHVDEGAPINVGFLESINNSIANVSLHSISGQLHLVIKNNQNVTVADVTDSSATVDYPGLQHILIARECGVAYKLYTSGILRDSVVDNYEEVAFKMFRMGEHFQYLLPNAYYDEIRLFNGVLSQAQITGLANGYLPETSEISSNITVSVSGGIQVSGDSTTFTNYDTTGMSGATVGGQDVDYAIYNWTPVDGVQLAGSVDCVCTYLYVVVGGVQSSGDASTLFTYSPFYYESRSDWSIYQNQAGGIELHNTDVLGNSGSYAMSIWVKVETGVDGYFVIASMDHVGKGELAADFTLGVRNLVWKAGDGVTNNINVTFTNFFSGFENKWVHLVLNVYVIGSYELVTAYRNGYFYSSEEVTPHAFGYGIRNIFLGRRWSGGSEFKGRLDEFRFKSSIYTSQEILTLARGEDITTGYTWLLEDYPTQFCKCREDGTYSGTSSVAINWSADVPVEIYDRVESGLEAHGVYGVENVKPQVTYSYVASGEGVVLTMRRHLYWKLDEGSGITISDQEGNYNGTKEDGSYVTIFNGTVPYSTSYQMYTDNSHFGIDYDIDSISGVHSWSLSMWINSIGGSSTINETIFEVSQVAGSEIVLLSNLGQLYLILKDVEGTAAGVLTSSTSLLTSTSLQHVVIVREAGTAWRMYIDGVETASMFDTYKEITLPNLIFGQSSTVYNDFIGYYDEIQLYDAAVSPEQVEKLFTGRQLDVAIVTTTNVYDISGSALCAGDAVVYVIDNETATGGSRVAGDAVIYVIDNETATGGSRVAGDAAISLIIQSLISGGTVCHGILDFANNPQSLNLVAWWPFIQIDYSSVIGAVNGVNGTLQNMNASHFVSDSERTHLVPSFNGVDQWILSQDIRPYFSTDEVTLSIWFYATESGVIVTELGAESGGAAWHDSQIEILNTGEVRVRVWNLTHVSVGTASFNTWNHAVVRYNTTTNILDGFLNGVEAASDVSGDRQAPYESGYNALHYGIGKSETTALGDGTFFGGKVVDFRVYNRALTNNEVAAMYHPTGRYELQESYFYPDFEQATYNVTSTSGASLTGSADIAESDNYAPTGGIQGAGTDLDYVIYLESPSGAAQLAGSAIATVIDAEIGNGGVQAAGDALVNVIDNELGTSGAQVSGQATDNVIFNEVSFSGAQLSGVTDQTFNSQEIASGGLQASGTDIDYVIYLETPSGAVQLAGSAINTVIDTETVSGGIQAAGDALVNVIDNELGTSGAQVSGQASDNIIFNEVSFSGAQLSGVADQTFNDIEIATGGLQGAGTDIDYVIYNEAPSGAITLSGSAIDTVIDTEIGSGGVQVAGDALVNVIDNELGTSGGQVSGQSTDNVTFNEVSVNGAQLSGVADQTFNDIEIATGGLQGAGTDIDYVIYNESPSGGSNLGGTAVYTVNNIEVVSGGIQAAGDALANVIDNEFGTSGVQISGQSTDNVTFNEVSINGAQLSGLADQTFNDVEIGSGGLQVSGAGTQLVNYSETVSGGLRIKLRPVMWLQANDNTVEAYGNYIGFNSGSGLTYSPGRYGNDSAFDSQVSNSYVSTNDSADIAKFDVMTVYTITAWFKRIGGVSFNNIFGRHSSTGKGFTLHIDPSGRVKVRIDSDTTANQNAGTSNTSAEGTWNLATLRIDENNNLYSISLNGTGTTNTSYVGSISGLSGGSIIIADSAVGASHFFGLIDDIRVYDRWLSEQDVLDSEYEILTVANVDFIANETSTSGTIVNGTSLLNFVYNESASAGIILSGTADQTFNSQEIASGGLQASGTDIDYVIYLETPSGASNLGGTAVDTVNNVEVVSGGMLAAGDVLVNVIDNEFGTSGVVNGGQGIDNVLFEHIPINGIQLSGTADQTFNDLEIGSGGLQATGTDIDYVIYNELPAGAITLGGSVVDTVNNVELASGGIQAAGDALVNVVDNEMGTAGVAVAGQISDNAVFEHIPINGAQLSGVADQTFNDIEIATGGLQGAGTDIDYVIYLELPSGAITLAGSAIDTVIDTETVSGGIKAAGDGETLVVYSEIGSSGTTIGGQSLDNAIFNHLSTNGVQLSGTADQAFNDIEIATGGLQATGTDIDYVIYLELPSGAITLAGSSIDTVIDTETVSGGIQAAGDALTNVIDNEFGTSGVQVSGQTAENIVFNYTSDSGLIVSGSSDTTFNDVEDGSGGLTISGITDCVAVFNLLANGGLKTRHKPLIWLQAENNTNDLYGNINMSSVTGNYATDRYGNNLAFAINSVDNIVTTSNSTDLNFFDQNKVFTVVFWYKLDAASTYAGLTGRKFSNNRGWQIDLTPTQRLRLRIDDTVNFNSWQLGPDYSNVYDWHLIALRMNLNNKTLGLSADGSSFTSFSYVGDFGVDGTGSLNIGYGFVNAFASYPLTARIDDYRVYDFWMTPEDVQSSEFDILTLANVQSSYFEITSGGASCSGIADVVVSTSTSGDGGLTASGNVNETGIYTHTPVDGVQLSGTADQTFNDLEIGSGGSQVAGTDIDYAIYNEAPSGAINLSGSATDTSNNVETGSGGIQSAGDSNVYIVYLEIGTSGAITSGQWIDNAIYNYTPVDGIQLSGTAEQTLNDLEIGSGGLQAAGTDIDYVIYNEFPLGSIALGGNAVDTTNNVENVNGGVQSSGDGVSYFVYNETTTSGIAVGGQGFDNTIYAHTPVDGIQLSGTAEQTVNDLEVGSGGSQVAGNGIDYVIYSELPSGSITLSGNATDTVNNVELVNGGLQVSGESSTITVYNEVFVSGVQVSGQAIDTVIYEQSAENGLMLSGTADNTFNDTEIGVGGIQSSGSSLEFVVYNETVTGSILAAGSATDTLNNAQDVNGGLQIAGDSNVETVYLETSLSGIFVSGQAVDNVVFDYPAENGIILSGTADQVLNDTEVASGGSQVAGNSLNYAIYNQQADGAISIGGNSTESAYNVEIADGGVQTSGTAQSESVYSETSISGVLNSGQSIENVMYFQTGSAGIALTGVADQTFNDIEVSEGGIQAAGDVLVSVIYDETSLNGTIVGGTTVETVNNVQDISGGCLSSGEATSNAIYSEVALSGSAIAGQNIESFIYNYNVESGIIVSGYSDQTFNDTEQGDGGIQASGAALQNVVYQEVFDGSSLVNGSGDENVNSQVAVFGGVSSGGLADQFVAYFEVASSGVTLGGQVVDLLVFAETASGGIATAGNVVVNVEYNEVAASGVACSGIAEQIFNDIEVGTGGIVASGDVVVNVIYLEVSSNGLQLTGNVYDTQEYWQEASSGVVLTGTATQTFSDEEIGQGGCLVEGSGSFNVEYNEVSVGGLVASGFAEQIAENVYVPNGGIIASGDALIQANVIELATAGASLSGYSDLIVTYFEYGVDGSKSSGSAIEFSEYYFLVENGSVCGGESVVEYVGIEVSGGNGVQLTGQAFNAIDYANVDANGILVSGSVAVDVIYEVMSESGSQATGQSSTAAIYEVISDAGVSLSGAVEQTIVDVEFGASEGVVASGTIVLGLTTEPFTSGGLTISGNAIETTSYWLETSHGVQVSGDANVTVEYANLQASGSVAGGLSETYQIANELGSSGIAITGVVDGAFNLEVISVGGITVAGDSEHNKSIDQIGQDGLVLAGSGLESVIYANIGFAGIKLDGQISEYAQYEQQTDSGIAVAGESQSMVVFNHLDYSGVLVAGDSLADVVTEAYIATGGVEVGGFASEESNNIIVSEGGIVTAGSGVEFVTTTVDSTSGCVLGGTLDSYMIHSVQVIGSIIASGYMQIILDSIIEGGVVSAGEANVSSTTSMLATSGAMLNGSAIIVASFDVTPSSGATIAGLISEQITYNLAMQEGLMLAGLSTTTYQTFYVTESGVLTTGLGSVQVLYNEAGFAGVLSGSGVFEQYDGNIVPSGGLLLNGEAVEQMYVPTQGGIVLSGDSDHAVLRVETPVDGVVLNGSSAVVVEFNETMTFGGVVGGKIGVSLSNYYVEAEGTVTITSNAEFKRMKFYNCTASGVVNTQSSAVFVSEKIAIGSGTIHIGGISESAIFTRNFIPKRPRVFLEGSSQSSVEFEEPEIIDPPPTRSFNYTTNGNLAVNGQVVTYQSEWGYIPKRIRVFIRGTSVCSVEFEEPEIIDPPTTRSFNYNAIGNLTVNGEVITSQSDWRHTPKKNRIRLTKAAVCRKSYHQTQSSGELTLRSRSEFELGVYPENCENPVPCISPDFECIDLGNYYSGDKDLDKFERTLDTRVALLPTITECRQKGNLPLEKKRKIKIEVS